MHSLRVGPIDLRFCSNHCCPSWLLYNHGMGTLDWLPQHLDDATVIRLHRSKVRLMLEAVCEPEAIMAASDPPAVD